MASEQDEFDTAEAAYWWLVQNHTGQGSQAYEVLSRLQDIYTAPQSVQRGKLSDEARIIHAGFTNAEDVNNALHDVGVF